MKRMRDITANDRPREKIAGKGAACLSDQELIAAIIGRGSPGKDVVELAREILPIIQKNPDAVSYIDLARVRGLGPAKASQLVASLEFGRRCFGNNLKGKKIGGPADILPLVSFLTGKKQEHFICISLSGAHEVLAIRTVTVGLLNHSLVHPREVYADAITDRAAAVICVHNHPSGTLEPSSQDLAITRQLRDAGTLLGIQLLDHLIITDSGWLSLKERGFM